MNGVFISFLVVWGFFAVLGYVLYWSARKRTGYLPSGHFSRWENVVIEFLVLLAHIMLSPVVFVASYRDYKDSRDPSINSNYTSLL